MDLEQFPILQVTTTLEDTERRLLKGYFKPGNAVSYADYSGDTPQVVSVCNEGQKGSEVYVFPKIEFYVPGSAKGTFFRGVNPAKSFVERVGPNQTFEYDRVDKQGRHETLVFRHMAPYVMKLASGGSIEIGPMN